MKNPQRSKLVESKKRKKKQYKGKQRVILSQHETTEPTMKPTAGLDTFGRNCTTAM
jgi:hypothetical protein